jgi:hypothetical protein
MNGRHHSPDDMANGADKTRMLDEGIVYWINQVQAAIEAVDPNALVTIGFFAPKTPNLWRVGDERYVVPMSVIEQSTLDFIGLHPYPVGQPLAQAMENFQVPRPSPKPIIMGEFGAFKFQYATAGIAAQALVDWQRQSCAYGFRGLAPVDLGPERRGRRRAGDVARNRRRRSNRNRIIPASAAGSLRVTRRVRT